MGHHGWVWVGGLQPVEGRSGSASWAVVALLLRPVLVFGVATALGHHLASRSDAYEPSGESYLDWIGRFWRIDEMVDGFEPVLQLIGGGTVVATIGGLLLGSVAGSRLGRASQGLWVPLVSAIGPLASVLAAYVAVERLSLAPAGAVSVLDDPVEAVRRLAAPAVAVAVPLMPALATMWSRAAPASEHYGAAAAGSLLADRSEPHRGWRFGFPVAGLIAGVVVAAVAFDRVDVGRPLAERPALALDVLGLVAAGAAVVTLVVDIVGLRPVRPTRPSPAALRLARYSTTPSSPTLLVLAAVGAIGLIVASVLRWGRGGDGSVDRALGALGPLLASAVVAGAVATVVAVGLVVAHQRLGPAGQVVPGAVIDALWWPLVPMVAVTAAAYPPGGPGPNAAMLVVVTVGLIPVGYRAVRREPLSADVGGMVRVVGAGFLVAAAALTALTAASFLLPTTTTPSLGHQVIDGLGRLGTNLGAALTPAAVVAAALLVLNGLGTSLIRLGWQATADRQIADLEEPEDLLLGAGPGPERPVGLHVPHAGPATAPGFGGLATAPGFGGLAEPDASEVDTAVFDEPVAVEEWPRHPPPISGPDRDHHR